MINSRMSDYNYYLLGDKNGYGQLTVIKDDSGNPIKQGTVKLSISTITQSVTDNLRYSDSTYLGLTHDKTIKDTFLIQYGDEVLKVQYVNTDGRYTQVFMGVYEH